MPRLSMHVEPSGTTATARHYVRDIVYGANDLPELEAAFGAGMLGASIVGHLR